MMNGGWRKLYRSKRLSIWSLISGKFKFSGIVDFEIRDYVGIGKLDCPMIDDDNCYMDELDV